MIVLLAALLVLWAALTVLLIGMCRAAADADRREGRL